MLNVQVGRAKAPPSFVRELAVTVYKVLDMLNSAMSSEETLMQEFVQTKQLLRAAEAEIRLSALQAFRHSLQVNLALEEGREPE